MSSNTEGPLETQDTSTESDESEKEVEKAEGNFEQLKIAEKDNSDEAADPANQEDASSSSVDLFNKIYAEQRGIKKAEGNLEHVMEEKNSGKSKAANQEGTLYSTGDLFNQIYAERRGLQNPHPHSSLDPECEVACSTAPSKENELEAKGIDEKIGTKMVEDYHKTSEKNLEAIASENFPVRMEEEHADYARSTPPICQSATGVSPTSMLQEISPDTAASSPRVDYNDASPLALADPLRPRSPFRSSSSRGFDDSTTENENTLADVSEIDSEIAEMSREGSVHQDASETIDKKEYAIQRQSPEGSDTDISEIQDFVPPPTSESSSLDQCIAPPPTPESSSLVQCIAPPPTPESSSLLQDYLPPHPTPASSIGSTSNLSGMLESESMADEPTSADQRMEVCDRPLEQERQNVENQEEMNIPEDARKRTSASILLVQKSLEVQDVEGSPSKRRRASIEVGDSSAEEGIAYRLRSRVKQDSEKKYKTATSKSSDLNSTSVSSERKGSSRDELHLKGFPKSKRLSGAQGTSNAEKGLLSTQQPMVSSIDSVMVEEKNNEPSVLKEQGHLAMEIEDPSLVKMETAGGEGVAKLVELSGTKPSTSSVYGSEGTLKEQEQSIGDFENEGSVEKLEQEQKLKERSDLRPTSGTQHDSGDPDIRVDLGNPQQSGSATSPEVSDISTIPPSEEETKF